MQACLYEAFLQELADQLMDGPPGVGGPGAFLRTFLLLKIEIYAFMVIHFLCAPHKNHAGCEEDQDRRLITQM